MKRSVWPGACVRRNGHRARPRRLQEGTETPCNGGSSGGPKPSDNGKSSNETPTTKASTQPSGFGSPAAPGYTRQPCPKPPEPLKHPSRLLRKPVWDRALSSKRGLFEGAGGSGLPARVHGPWAACNGQAKPRSAVAPRPQLRAGARRLKTPIRPASA